MGEPPAEFERTGGEQRGGDGAGGRARRRVERLARGLERPHRRALIALVLAGGAIYPPAGLARSRLHGWVEGVSWPAALEDTTLAVALHLALFLPALLLYLARGRLGPRRYATWTVAFAGLLAALVVAEVGLRLFHDPRTPVDTVLALPLRAEAVGEGGLLRYRPTAPAAEATPGEPGAVAAVGSLAASHPGTPAAAAAPQSAAEVPYLINALGLRGPEVALPRPPGTVRILALGDSYTFAQGVLDEEAVWPARVAALLRARFPGRAIDFVNTGHPGYDARRQAAALAHYLDLVQPDLVLVGVCQNDHWIVSERLDQAARWRGAFVPADLAGPAVRRSALGNLLALAYDQTLLRLGVREQRDDVLLRTADPAGPDWQAFLAAHREIAALCGRRGLPPPVAQVLLDCDADGIVADGGTLRRRYLEGLAGSGALLVDAMPEYAASDLAERDLRVSPWDAHPNALAQDLYARAFVRALEEAGLLDPDGPFGR